MEKVRLGVVGVSNHFLKRIILPLKELDCVEIKAIASRNNKKATDFAHQFEIEKSYGEYQSLMDDANIDAVYIPLPNHLHAEWIKKAASAGKHVLCEKPLCMNAEEVADVIEHCLKCNVILMEAFMYKHHPQWIKVRDIIRTNNIGDIKYINTSFSYNNPSPSNIRNIKEYGGGGMRDIGCYAISVARFLLEKEPKRVIGLLNYHPDFETDMLSTGILDFGKCRATFNVSTSANAFQKVDIVGSAGRITVRLPFNTYNDVEAIVTVDSAIGQREIKFAPMDQYCLMIEDFATMIRKKQAVSKEEDDAFLNQKVMDAIFKSVESESWELIN
jgi:predicted dehydrogenase